MLYQPDWMCAGATLSGYVPGVSFSVLMQARLEDANPPLAQSGPPGIQQQVLPAHSTPNFMHHLCLQTLYNAMLENNCSESASRMSAMENSTKSAGEMLGALTLAYNRCVAGRQGVMLRRYQLIHLWQLARS